MMLTSHMKETPTVPEERRVACRRCGHVMQDGSPRSESGEFVHARRVCSNSKKRFSVHDTAEIDPLERTRSLRKTMRTA